MLRWLMFETALVCELIIGVAGVYALALCQEWRYGGADISPRECVRFWGRIARNMFAALAKKHLVLRGERHFLTPKK